MPKCKGCGAEIIWTKTANGKVTPIDAKKKKFYINLSTNKFSTQALEGHESHWATCPMAKDFKRRKGE